MQQRALGEWVTMPAEKYKLQAASATWQLMEKREWFLLQLETQALTKNSFLTTALGITLQGFGQCLVIAIYRSTF